MGQILSAALRSGLLLVVYNPLKLAFAFTNRPSSQHFSSTGSCLVNERPSNTSQNLPISAENNQKCYEKDGEALLPHRSSVVLSTKEPMGNT